MMRKTSNSTLVKAAALAAASLFAAPAVMAEPVVTSSLEGRVLKVAARSGDTQSPKAELQDNRYQGHDDKRRKDDKTLKGGRDDDRTSGRRDDRRVSDRSDDHGSRDRHDDHRDMDRRGDDRRMTDRRDHQRRGDGRHDNRPGDTHRDTRRDNDRRDWAHDNRNDNNRRFDDRRHDGRNTYQGGVFSDRGGRGRTALVTCSSGDYRVQRCSFNVGFAVRDARVHRLQSRADCIRGRDWNIDGRSIWVKDGCRAVFEISATLLPGNQRWTDSRYDRRDPWGNDGYARQTYPGDRRGFTSMVVSERQAIQACLRRASRVAWNQGRHNEGYMGPPNILVGRRGKLHVTGKMRLEGRNGLDRAVGSRCVVNNGHVEEFGFR